MRIGSTAKLWSSPIVAILLVGVANWWSRQPPERFFTTETVVLDAADATSDSGHAYWIPMPRAARGLSSDKEGISQVVFLEEGAELTGHALHAKIRSREGLYSHWGSAILFSARDGSNPRANGRRYEVRLPPSIPGWHGWAQIGLFVAAVLLLLQWLHARIGGSWLRTLAWTSGGAATLAILALGAALASPAMRELRTIRETVSAPGRAEPETADAGRPRTRHFLQSEVTSSFVTEAPPPAERQPRTITLHRTEGARQERGYTKLVPESALRNLEPLDVRASDLESLVLELDVKRGASLCLFLSHDESLDEGSDHVELSFPVSASDEPQIVRFERPALGGMGLVRFVAIRKDPRVDGAPLVRVRSVTYSLRLDAFTDRPSGLDAVELKGGLRPALWQGVPGRFSFPLNENDGALLKLAVGALAESEVSIDFAVSAILHGGQRSVLHRGSIHPRDGWRELILNLPEEGASQLLLEGQRLSPRSALLWSGVRLIDTRRPPRRLVMILADTLRADALGCYGHEGDPTPALDALARQGVRFDRAFSQTYWTRPSMASIMTGHYAAATGVQSIDQRLSGSYVTLAERLAAGGFTTVGFVTNSNAGPHAGLEQGFSRMHLLHSLSDSQLTHTDRLISEVVLPTLDELEQDDVFLYLHLMEAHGPYGPPEPPGAEVHLPTGGSPLPFDPAFDRPWNKTPTADQRVALYEYDVRSLDRALGELFAQLDRRWQTPDGTPPILAFVSDHGEHLGERGQWGHKFSDLYPENVQVPMILRAPGRIAPDTVFPDPVEIRHLGQTLLDLAGLAAPPPAIGSGEMAWSLLPLLEGTIDPLRPRFAVSASEEGDIATFSLFGRQHGYIARIAREQVRIAVFSDSGLDHRITAWPRSVLEHGLLKVRRSYLKSQTEIRDRMRSHSADSIRRIDAEAIENLKALGYIEN